jgi:SAM-dependent methyltransferase
MTQNIYDNDAFFAGYSQLGRSLEGLDGAAEWPALQAMLPPMAGLRVADLGCGFGWFCRWARGAGAESVSGFDVSENMLARARGFGADPAISYARADLEDLRLDAGYDLVYSSLTFHYIVGFAGLLARIHQALKPGGRLVFSIEHPIYMAPSQPRFTLDAEGRRVWPIDRYLEEGPRQTDWLAKGVIKQHRTIGTTIGLLLGAGFTLDHLEEWSPTDAQIAARPALAQERDRPMFLLAAAHR